MGLTTDRVPRATLVTPPGLADTQGGADMAEPTQPLAARSASTGEPGWQPPARVPHIEHFVHDLRRRKLSPETIRRYRNSLLRFERQAGVSLLEATRDDLRDWLDTMRVAPRTTFWYVSTLRVFYNWALDEELLARSPAAGLVTPRYGRLVPRPIGRDDLELALHGARPRMKAWLALAAFAGFRAKEIAGLRREDVLDMVEPPVLVVSAPKGGRQRVVPLNPYVAHALRLAGLPRFGLGVHVPARWRASAARHRDEVGQSVPRRLRHRRHVAPRCSLPPPAEMMRARVAATEVDQKADRN